jgi:glutamyl-tRNA reductase
MSIILVGLNHHTAPVGLQERLSLTSAELCMALKELHMDYQSSRSCTGQTNMIEHITALLREGIILSTRNRLEVYAVARDTVSGWRAIERFLTQPHGIPLDLLRSHLYFLEGRAAVEHLMRVATVLDSMVLGEPQILGQVAEAFSASQTGNTIGAILSRLFSEAVHTGKRAHRETAASHHTTSVGHAAVLLMQTKISDLRCARVLVVGAGEMAQLAARALQMHGAQTITYIN